MKLVVGLGNPGEKYQNSRHNVGFMVVDELLRRLAPVSRTKWQESKKGKALYARLSFGKGEIELVKPLTFMNNSGFTVSYVVRKHRLKPENIYVIHDDLDLSLGKIKIRKDGGSAGHRGIDSIVKELETYDFIRFRLGIGHPRQKPKGHLGGQAGPGLSEKEVEGYVLSPFERGEKSQVRRMVKQAVEAIKLALEEGLEKAMNRFNP